MIMKDGRRSEMVSIESRSGWRWGSAASVVSSAILLVGCTQAGPMNSSSSRGGAAKTETVRIEPIAAGKVDARFSIESAGGTGTIACAGRPSPVAVTSGTFSCGSTADAAFACWQSPTNDGALLCLRQAWSTELTELMGEGMSKAPLPAPARPHPLGVELDDGTRWNWRSGGAAPHTPEGTLLTYLCAVGTGCSQNEGLVSVQGSSFDVHDGIWTAHRARLGDTAEGLPAPVAQHVVKVYFIAGDRATKPPVQSQTQGQDPTASPPTSKPSTVSTSPAGAEDVVDLTRFKTIGFTSPSGRIKCALTSRMAQCGIEDSVWAYPDPASQENICGTTDYGVVALAVAQKVGWSCGGGQPWMPGLRANQEWFVPLKWPLGPAEDLGAGRDHAAAIPYGKAVKIGDIMCSSKSTGMTCANTSTGAAFTIAREKFEFVGPQSELAISGE